MTDEIKKITIQLRAPRGKDAGKVAEGYYTIAEDHVVLTDETGRPTGSKRHLDPGGDARLIACRMLRQRQSATGSGNFNRPMQYPRGY
jgi:hypothetical protein